MSVVDAAASITAIDWGSVVTFTLATLIPAAIIGVGTWALHRWVKARADAQAAKIAAIVVQNFTTLESRVTQRIDVSDAATTAQVTELKSGQADLGDKVAELQLKFATETGGNSNGLRQEVNSISTAVARLEGAFEQHLTENPKQ